MGRKLKSILILLISWTLLACLFTPQTYLSNLKTQNPLNWEASFIFNLLLFYLWAILTPLVWFIGKSFPIEKERQWQHFTFIVLLAFPIVFLHIFLLQRLIQLTPDLTPLPFRSLMIGIGATNILFYLIIIIVSQADIYFRRYHERENSLTKAQLQSLKTQLHPHFLFNTLNAISQLLYENEAEAERTISKLSDLLRLSLKGDQKHEVTLREELDFLRMYLEIQQTLLQDRLEVIWRILPQTLEALLPSMILQPIVENSIQHGIAPRISGGTIKIIATQEDNYWLTIRIFDDGIGLGKKITKTSRIGIGLSNTEKRLKHLYGKDHEFYLRPAPDGVGTVMLLKIPFRNNQKEGIYENPNSDSGRYAFGTETHPAFFEQRFGNRNYRRVQ